MQENESLRDFMRRFRQVVLQVESYNMEAIFTRQETLNPQTNRGKLARGGIAINSRISHTTEQCRSLHYLVEKLIQARHLKQFVLSTGGQREMAQDLAIQAPASSATPRVVINYIHRALIDERYNSKRKRKNIANARNALILTLGISGFDIRRVLVDPGSSADLLEMSTYIIQFSVVKDLSPFNAIMGHAWLHRMKVVPSIYHQMGNYLTEEGQVDLLGSQLAVCQYYQVALDSGHPSGEEARPNHQVQGSNSILELDGDPFQPLCLSYGMIKLPTLALYSCGMSWAARKHASMKQRHLHRTHSYMPRIYPFMASHKLHVTPSSRPIRQRFNISIRIGGKSFRKIDKSLANLSKKSSIRTSWQTWWSFQRRMRNEFVLMTPT
ncbi:hypothetical protein AAG906_025522 [Vitis piasezkii]